MSFEVLQTFWTLEPWVVSSKQITLSDKSKRKKKNGRKQSFFFVAFIHQDEGCTLVIDVDKRGRGAGARSRLSSYCSLSQGSSGS